MKVTDPLAGYKTITACVALVILGVALILGKLDTETFLALFSGVLGLGLYGLRMKIERRG